MTGKPHVFLSYSRGEAAIVEAMARRLRDNGIEPWLDKWNLVPGEPWQPALEEALGKCAACLVFVGRSGMGPWQHEEMRVAIDRRVTRRDLRVIPVLLPGAERGRRSTIPSFLANVTWVEFHHQLDDPDAFHRLLSGIQGKPPGMLATNRAVDVCPYKGLQAFDIDDSSVFFGREALTDWLVSDLRNSLRPGANRFLAVVGASGCGKSSLARAGLMAALRRGAIDGSSAWPQIILRPGPDPLESLAVAGAQGLGLGADRGGVRAFIEDLRTNENSLHLQAALALRATPGRRLVVFVDQFEELFTLCTDDARRTAFIRTLLHAARVSHGPTLVALTLRADFVGRCASDPGLAAALSDGQELIGPLAEDEIRAAIERPALGAGVDFEAGLIEALMKDFEAQPGGLPLLQHALFELWRRRHGSRLTHDAYEQTGRVRGALDSRANEIYDSFLPAQKEIARRLFLRLTQPGEGTEDTRRRATFTEVVRSASEADDVEQVVHALVQARLLVTEGDAERRTLDVAHEALIRGWKLLRSWIEEDRDSLRAHRRLTAAAEEWQLLGKDESALFRGLRLDQALEWRRGNDTLLNLLERSFLEASEALHRDLEYTKRQAAWTDLARQVAHEVKNPLTPIQLNAEHLRRVFRDRGADFESTLELCTQSILQQVARLRRIVTEFSAFEGRPVGAREPQDMRGLLEDALSPYLAALPPEVSLRLEVAGPAPVIRVNRRFLEQAVINLVENALQAVGERGNIAVRLARRDGRVEVEVEDTGPGLDPKIRDLVFEPFFSTRTGHGGVGLALVKKIAEDHGGGVSLISQPGRGTRAVLWLPADPDRPG